MKVEKVKTDLTQEQVKDLFDYDNDNGILIRKFKSGKRKPCGHAPARSDGYGQVRINGKNYLTHRIIWLWVYGKWPKNEIDHIDQNKMNNRIDNLRVVSRSENKHNLRLYRNNSSGYIGVYFNKRANKHHAQIYVNDKCIYLGLFATAEEAYLAYQLAKIEYHPTSPMAKEYFRELTVAG